MINKINKLYVQQKMSQDQVALHLGISRRKVQRIMARHGLKARTYALASSIMNERRFHGFNKEQEQLIFGSMLGDACLCRSVMKSNKTGKSIEIYKLHFAHSIKQLKYLKHKRAVIGGCKIGTRKSAYGSIIKYFAFSHTPTLRKYAEIFHDKNHNKKRVSSEWIKKIDWPALAYWYMDDGCLIMAKNKYFSIRFHTESYSRAELVLLQDMLVQFGLDTKLIRSPNPNPDERIIASKHKYEVIKFLRKLTPWIVPSMKYKIRCLDDV